MSRSGSQKLIGITVALLMSVAVAAGLLNYRLYRDALATASHDNGQMAALLHDQVLQAVQGIDVVTEEVADHASSIGGGDGASTRRVLQSQATFGYLNGRLLRLQQAAGITIADRDGVIVNSTRQWPASGPSVADRDYFAILKSGQHSGLFVGKPVRNRLTGSWTIPFVRGLTDAAGQFLGVVIVGVHPEYFLPIYNAVTAVSDRTFQLTLTDGTILIRDPGGPALTGTTIQAAPDWYRALANGSGTFRSRDADSGAGQIVSVETLVNYPIAVSLFVPEKTVLATWSDITTLFAFCTAIVVFGSALLLRILFKQVRRLSNSEELLRERKALLTLRNDELERTRSRLDAALTNMAQGLAMFDKNQKLVFCNDQYLRLYRIAPDQAPPGTSVHDIVRMRIERGIYVEKSADQYLDQNGLTTLPNSPVEALRVDHLEDGRVIRVTRRYMLAGGWVTTHEDITELNRKDARIAFMAHHDILTGLANRTRFMDKIEEARSAYLDRGSHFAVLMLDLDRFKNVNDSLGHFAGDVLLKDVARRLQAVMSEADTLARLGGDEFAIVQVAPRDDGGDASLLLTQNERAAALAARIIEAFDAPFELNGKHLAVSTSIGIAVAPDDGTDPDSLMKKADLALYEVKSFGRKAYRFFNQRMMEQAFERQQIEADLRLALARDEFELHYQPVVDVKTRRSIGAEALVRWRHPEHGMIAPGRFIPVAEDSALIIPLGEWVMRQACREAAQWPDDLRVSVNLSPAQFKSFDLIEMIFSALAESGLPPQRLEIEVTETVLLDKETDYITLLHHLKKAGISIALDDFGTGYSSLSYLKLFPFDKIKIDRSFIADIAERDDCAAIVCSVSGLGRSLNMVTTAEGIETEQQFEIVRAGGVTLAQGYLFGRPGRSEQLDFLANRDADAMAQVA